MAFQGDLLDSFDQPFESRRLGFAIMGISGTYSTHVHRLTYTINHQNMFIYMSTLIHMSILKLPITTHTYTYFDLHTHPHTRTHSHTYTYPPPSHSPHTHTHAHTHTHTHIYTQTHTHAHIHTQVYPVTNPRSRNW